MGPSDAWPLVKTSDDLTLDELLVLLAELEEAPTITLCGSSRFGWAFNAASRYFTLPPRLYKVLSIGDVKSSDADLKRHSVLTEEDAVRLDLLHLQKMRGSQVVCFLNPLQHFGVSTQREYAFAKRLGLSCLFAEVSRVVVEEGCRIDYRIEFIDDPVEAGRVSLAVPPVKA